MELWELDIAGLTEKLEEELGPPGPPGPPEALPPALYHYTDTRGFQGILTGKKIWATDYRFLNDTGEITLGEDLVLSTAAVLRDASSGLERKFLENFCEGDDDGWLAGYKVQRLTRLANIYVASSSANGNQLSQWRAYAGNGGGYCIGLKSLPSPDVLQKLKPEFGVMPVLVGVRCEYNEDSFREMVRDALTRVAALFRKKMDEGKVKAKSLRVACLWLAIQRVGILVPRLKHSAFSEEQEWRVIMMPTPDQMKHLKLEYRVSSQGLVPYIELPLTDETATLLPLHSVRVGPTQDANRGCEVAGTFLHGLGYSSSLVVPSNIPFRAP